MGVARVGTSPRVTPNTRAGYPTTTVSYVSSGTRQSESWTDTLRYSKSSSGSYVPNRPPERAWTVPEPKTRSKGPELRTETTRDGPTGSHLMNWRGRESQR